MVRFRGRGATKVNAAAALIISPGKRRRVRLRFKLYEENMNGPLFAQFVRFILREVRGRVLFIWDSLRAHLSPQVKALIASTPRASVQLLPTYAPELNPVETVWSYIKEVGLRGYVPETTLSLELEAGFALGELGGHQKNLRGCVRNTPLKIVGIH